MHILESENEDGGFIKTKIQKRKPNEIDKYWEKYEEVYMDVRIKFVPKYRDKGICSISDTKWLQEKTINLLDFESDFENKKNWQNS